MKIFLSYNSRKEEIVHDFNNELRGKLSNVIITWLDKERLTWGDTFPTKLSSTIMSDMDILSSSWITRHIFLIGFKKKLELAI